MGAAWSVFRSQAAGGVRAWECLVFDRLQAIETRPPIVCDRRGFSPACSKSSMPSGKPATISLRYGSDGSGGAGTDGASLLLWLCCAMREGVIGSECSVVPRVGMQDANG